VVAGGKAESALGSQRGNASEYSPEEQRQISPQSGQGMNLSLAECQNQSWPDNREDGN
jgi:hypothetical protein